MKGTERNALCPCGSGYKTKHCLGTQRHIPTAKEMEDMHAIALLENYYEHTEHGRLEVEKDWHARRHRARHALALLSVLGGSL